MECTLLLFHSPASFDDLSTLFRVIRLVVPRELDHLPPVVEATQDCATVANVRRDYLEFHNSLTLSLVMKIETAVDPERFVSTSEFQISLFVIANARVI